MKKILLITALLCGVLNTISAQNSPINQPAVGITSSDNFTYNTFTVSHYGLGWYYDPQFGPPMVYLSAYGGLKFFTAGTPRAILDWNGYFGIGTLNPQATLHLKIDNNFSMIQRSSTAYYAGHYYGTGPDNAIDYNFFTGLRENSDSYCIYNGYLGADALIIDRNNSNVGIGKADPGFKLDVNGVINTSSYVSSAWGVYVDGATNVGINNSSGALAFRTNGVDNRMNIDVNGNVGIGTTTTHGYRFAVNGDIHTKKVVVDLINWPDYVFKPTYALKSLAEVKAYIDQNHHLPEMPSEKEVADIGVDLGEMNKLLTKKVEELTLYLIEKDKQVQKEQQINRSQQGQIDELRKILMRNVKNK